MDLKKEKLLMEERRQFCELKIHSQKPNKCPFAKINLRKN